MAAKDGTKITYMSPSLIHHWNKYSRHWLVCTFNKNQNKNVINNLEVVILAKYNIKDVLS